MRFWVDMNFGNNTIYPVYPQQTSQYPCPLQDVKQTLKRPASAAVDMINNQTSFFYSTFIVFPNIFALVSSVGKKYITPLPQLSLCFSEDSEDPARLEREERKDERFQR